MALKIQTYILLLPLVAQLTEGKDCWTKEGLEGICKPLPDCKTVKLNTERIKPTVCSYSSFFPVVCCPIASQRRFNYWQTVKATPKPAPTPTLPLFSKDVTSERFGIKLDALNVPEGNNCWTKEGLEGMCKPLPDCETVKLSIERIKPTVCSYSSFFPVVCCPIASQRRLTYWQTVKITPTPTPTLPPISKDVTTIETLSIGFGIKLDALNVPGCGDEKDDNFQEVQLADIITRAFPHRNSKSVQGLNEHEKEPKILFIVGGRPAKQHAWPWMAAIYRRVGGRLTFECGGTLINSQYILTAAHCFLTKTTSSDPDNIVVRLGETKRSEFGESNSFEVERIIIHKDFRPPMYYNDIALLKIRKKVSFTRKIKPICLPTSLSEPSKLVNKLGTVLGWGSQKFAGRDSDTLNEVDIPITTEEYCNKTYASIRIGRSYPKGIISSLVCAGYKQGGKDSCQGDSGGPLMVTDENGRFNIGGIVSGGFQCAKPKFPGLYTRVSSYLQWIAENIA